MATKTSRSKVQGARGAVPHPSKSTGTARRTAKAGPDIGQQFRAGATQAERTDLVAPVAVPEDVAKRQQEVRKRRVEASKRVVEAGPVSDLAAPGRVHQPVKESGLGTPSADARPGRSAWTGLPAPLELTEEESNAVLQARAKDRLKVQATQTGYYDDIRRRPGEIFFITGYIDGDGRTVPAAESFSPRWMKRVSDKTPVTGTKGPNQVIRERHDELLGARAARRLAGEKVGKDEDLNPIGAED